MKELKLFDADGVAFSVEELSNSLIFLRIDEDKIEELHESLMECDAIRDLKNASFLLTGHDIEIAVTRRDDLTLMSAKKISKKPDEEDPKMVIFDG